MNKLGRSAGLVGLSALITIALACGGGGSSGGSSGETGSSGAAGGAVARVATAQAEQTAVAKATATAFEAMVSATAAVTAPSATLEITARNVTFDKTVLVAPANTDVTVKLIYAETGTFAGDPHNFSVYRERSLQEKIYVSQTDTKTVEHRFRTPGPGTYYFRCDPHPGSMEGAFVVK